MSRSGEIELYFGDTKRPFRLALKQLRKLQEKCADKIKGERGPFVVLQSLLDGTWRPDDVVWTIQLGLVGGGMKEEDAAKLVAERFEERVGLYDHTLTAAAILRAAIIGPEEDKIDPGKRPAEEGATTAQPPSPTSTDRPPSSGGPPGTSMN